MENSPLDKEVIQHKFSGYCYSILKNEAIDCFREIERRKKHEALFSELTQSELNQMYVLDNYDLAHCEKNSCFKVMDMDIEVSSTRIAKALAALKEKNRFVILMAYFLDMTESEIARCLNLKQSTIHYHKAQSLKKLKEIMEKNGDDE